MTEVGKPLLFSIDKYLDSVEEMICSDEVELALNMLDKPPAYYRDNPTSRMLEIRESLHRVLWTPVQYQDIYEGVTIDEAEILRHWPLRSSLVEKEIEKLGGAHLMEVAPGSKWLPWGLHYKKLKFTYECKSVDHIPHDDIFLEPWSEDPDSRSKNIFICFELIEHLSNPWEIYQNYLKFKKEADVVMISTPLYTFGGGLPDWRNRPLGHLRTYSPSELHSTIAKMFGGYKWEAAIDNTIVMVGRKNT